MHWKIGGPLRAGGGNQVRMWAGRDHLDVRERRGGSTTSSTDSQSIRSSFSFWPFWRSIFCLPSAGMQGAEHLSALTLSVGLSLVVGTVAGFHTWSEGLGSGSPSSVGSGMRSTHQGDGGLGSGSEVDLARSSTGQMVSGDPFLARVHSTNAANSSRGPSSDDNALHS